MNIKDENKSTSVYDIPEDIAALCFVCGYSSFSLALCESASSRIWSVCEKTI